MSDGEEEAILWASREDTVRAIQLPFSPERANAFKERARETERKRARQGRRRKCVFTLHIFIILTL